MKTLWNIVSFLAVVNLLALVMFVLWLWQSDRLNADRVEEVRSVLAPTVAEAEAMAAEEQREAEEARRAAEDEMRRLSPPVSSAARVEQIARLEELERRTKRRLDDAQRLRLADLDRALARLEEREAALEAAKKDWEEQIQQEVERRRDEQFAKTVRQYESIPPRQAKDMLLELIAEEGMDQAVAYLDAMNARNASKIIEAFRTDEEIRLATELLERLRIFGLPAGAGTEVAQETSNAN